MNSNRDWQGKTQGGKFGLKPLLFFFKIIPLSVGYFILWFIIPFYIVFARKGYKSIYHYFRTKRKLFPLKSFFKTFQNHYRFGQILLDRFALFAGKKNVFSVEVEGNEIITDLIAKKEGGIIVSSHVGNFEIAGYLFSMGNSKMHGLIFGEENPTMLQFRNEILAKNKISLIPVSPDLSHMFTIMNVIKKGEFVAIPGDRSFHGTRIQPCKFLGKETNFPTGAFNIADKLNVPVISLFVMKSGRKTYKIYIKHIEPKIENKYKTKQDKVTGHLECFVKEVETIVKTYPEQWFNFYDFWNDMNPHE